MQLVNPGWKHPCSARKYINSPGALVRLVISQRSQQSTGLLLGTIPFGQNALRHSDKIVLMKKSI